MKRILILVLILFAFARPCFAEKWTFTVIADNRSDFASYRNVLERIRDVSTGPQDDRSSVDFIVAVGDISPLQKNHSIFKEVFPKSRPFFMPVRGNHEKTDDVRFLLTEILPSQGNGIHLRKEGEVSYYTDWKNVRIIALDQYAGFGKSLSDANALSWLGKALETAMDVEHIFIAFHEPYFPENTADDPFWSLLLKHRDKVRAVLCGHYHIYFRKYFPDNGSDILYINAGNAGRTSHGDEHQTIVAITVDGKDIAFQAIQAPDKSKDFRITDEWEFRTEGKGRASKLDNTAIGEALPSHR